MTAWKRKAPAKDLKSLEPNKSPMSPLEASLNFRDFALWEQYPASLRRRAQRGSLDDKDVLMDQIYLQQEVGDHVLGRYCVCVYIFVYIYYICHI